MTEMPIEFRAAGLGEVKPAKRLIEVVAVPYDQPTQAPVPYRGELWTEVFERGSFDGIETRQGEVRVNRDHDRTRTVGKVLTFWPSRTEGLVSEVRVAKTPLGDETLALAEEDMLSASVGFAVKKGSDQVLDVRSMMRRIKRAFLDHLSFVESPAYAGASVVDVRQPAEPTLAAGLPRLVTPQLDELLEWQRNRRR